MCQCQCQLQSVSVVLSRVGFSRRQVQFKLWRQLLIVVGPIREVDPTDATIGMDLHPECLLILRTVGSLREVGQVELNLIPALVEVHWHRANERLDPSG